MSPGASDTVVVSGLGVVNPGFWGVDEAKRAFADPDPRPVEVDRSAGYHRNGSPRLALLVDASRQADWLKPMAARRMSPASRFAVCAALMAVRDAGLDVGDLEGETAVILGTGYGAATITERILRQIFLEGPEAVSPALFTESVANAPAAQIALALKARGANITVTQRRASVAVALERALTLLRKGRAYRVMVGAVDELNPLLHAVLGRVGALARPDVDGQEQAHPFDERASGWIAAEGAAVALLERADTAAERRARVHARVVASGTAFDPTAPRNGWSRSPDILARALQGFLERHDVPLQGIDRVVSSACGHRASDRLEAGILQRVWGDRELPAVLVPAATAGCHGGGLMAGAVLAAAGCQFGATPGFSSAMSGVRLAPHDGRKLAPPGRTVAISAAAGGSAGWTVLEGPPR